MKALMALTLMMTLALPVLAEQTVIDFSKTAFEEYGDLKQSSKVGSTDDGSSLQIEDSGVAILKMPVNGGVKYKLEVEARVVGGLTIEENDRAMALARERSEDGASSSPIHYYRIRFQDTQGVGINQIGRYRLEGNFITKELATYTYVFYAPPDAVSLTIGMEAHKGQLIIRSVKLAPETEEGTINPNPDLRYGDRNYSGWRPTNGGQIQAVSDGRYSISSGHGGGSPPFLVVPGEEYEISAQGNGGQFRIDFMTLEGNKGIESRRIAGSLKGEAGGRVLVPEGAEYAVISFFGDSEIEKLSVRKPAE